MDTWAGWQGSYIYNALIKLPRTLDLRLVGKWRGARKRLLDPDPPHGLTTIFEADGTGRSDDWERPCGRILDWGTEGGVLYTRRMATDAWSGERHRYALSDGGKTVTFANNRMFGMLSGKMER